MNKISNHMPTAELQALDAAHHMHPFTDGAALAAAGVRVIKSAKGVMLTDSEGREILDGMAGLWCMNIGYGREEMAEVAARQMRELPFYNTFFMTTHVPAIALSQKLAEISPDGFNNVFYAGSGSEANDTNIRLVRHYWACKGEPDRKVIISRKNGYHGSSMGSGSLGGMSYMHEQGGMPIPDIYHIDQPDWWTEGGDLTPDEFGLERARQLEEAIQKYGPKTIAAFIAEPMQGAGGVIVPPDTYWPEIQRICDEYGILLIADEVICGFGRTGEWFGSTTYNIKPHIMTIAKGLSSGYVPIGGSMICDEIADVVNNAGDFNHGYTYSGHPVSTAVALENLRIIEEERLVERVRDDIGPYLKEKWEALTDHPLIGQANIKGLMGSIVMTPHKESRAKFEPNDGSIGLYCRTRCFENGLVMRHVGNRMIISPPLVISKDEVDMLIERAIKSLDQTYTWAKSEGHMTA